MTTSHSNDGQGDLFRDAVARRTDPPTAHAAAATVDTARLEGIVLKYLKLRGGMTTHELAKATRIELVSISPRMKPLTRKNLVYNSGQKRRGSSGRASIIWEAR